MLEVPTGIAPVSIRANQERRFVGASGAFSVEALAGVLSGALEVFE